MSDNRPVATRRGLGLTRLQLLWSFASPHRGTLAGGALLGLIGSAAGLATPMITNPSVNVSCSKRARRW
ncbi:hypothetical protein [Mycobacterium sp. DL592]|uniref:hypothetical protein n=1 Tax=Mycobacterium sp. DL592 TaxID=2675524 RepID=UPI001FB8B63F|nr:hypothetical protein [Mycobacterium sp. DL592]